MLEPKLRITSPNSSNGLQNISHWADIQWGLEHRKGKSSKNNVKWVNLVIKYNFLGNICFSVRNYCDEKDVFVFYI